MLGGEAFADVAAELSDDVGSAEAGGSLGVIAPGAMVPEFEEAVFALENEGDLSEPVRTDFGLHLIRLDAVTPESGKPFDEVREEIVATMRSEQADREFFELRGELTEIVFDESTSLEPAADATGLDVQSSDWLDADTIAEAGPVLANPAMLAAANDPEVLEAGNNSELIEVGPRHVVALRVTDSEGPRPKALEDVRERVVDEIREARAGARLDELAASALEALENGDVASDIASEVEPEGLAEALVGERLERQSTTFDGAVVAEIFALARPEADAPRTGTSTLGDGDRLAYALRAVESPATPCRWRRRDEADGAVRRRRWRRPVPIRASATSSSRPCSAASASAPTSTWSPDPNPRRKRAPGLRRRYRSAIIISIDRSSGRDSMSPASISSDIGLPLTSRIRSSTTSALSWVTPFETIHGASAPPARNMPAGVIARAPASASSVADIRRARTRSPTVVIESWPEALPSPSNRTPALAVTSPPAFVIATS